MPLAKIRDMDATDEYFVGACTHVGESDEINACARRRLTWLRGMHEKGLRVKVAFLDDNHVRFLYVMPIEICPWGPRGRDLLAIPCLVVKKKMKGKGGVFINGKKIWWVVKPLNKAFEKPFLRHCIRESDKC